MLLQTQLSEKQAAIAYASGELQQQQERYITLQNKAEADSREAAAAAARQVRQTKKLKQQMEIQLDAAQQHGERLQSLCDARGREKEQLTTELSEAQASAEESQVSFASCHCECCSLLHMDASGVYQFFTVALQAAFILDCHRQSPMMFRLGIGLCCVKQISHTDGPS